jgi:hypothetical protein
MNVGVGEAKLKQNAVPLYVLTHLPSGVGAGVWLVTGSHAISGPLTTQFPSACTQQPENGVGVGVSCALATSAKSTNSIKIRTEHLTDDRVQAVRSEDSQDAHLCHVGQESLG